MSYLEQLNQHFSLIFIFKLSLKVFKISFRIIDHNLSQSRLFVNILLFEWQVSHMIIPLIARRGIFSASSSSLPKHTLTMYERVWFSRWLLHIPVCTPNCRSVWFSLHHPWPCHFKTLCHLQKTVIIQNLAL